MSTEPQPTIRNRALWGGAVGVVSLGSPPQAEALAAGCEELRKQIGCPVVRPATEMRAEYGFAGSAEARSAALTELWRRDDVHAIVCTRGGYGSNYLLPLLDFDAMRAAPKSFVGYSDNTSILVALDRAGIVCFHGPMVASDFACDRGCDRYDVGSFFGSLNGAVELPFVFREKFNARPHDVRALVSGEARGTITGGCLSVVITTLGTPWEIETRGKILFLEDVNERPFRIDRMLMHLLLAGKFEGVRGIVFGVMMGCDAAVGEEPLPELILRILGQLGVPIVFGFPSGHVERGNLTLPFGVPAHLVASEVEVALRVQAATLPGKLDPQNIQKVRDRLLNGKS